MHEKGFKDTKQKGEKKNNKIIPSMRRMKTTNINNVSFALVPYVSPFSYYSLLRKILIIPCIWILYIRSYFVKDRTILFLTLVLPVLHGILIYLHAWYPEKFTIFIAFYMQIHLGCQLIIYDILGAKIASNTLTQPNPILSLTFLLSLGNKRIVRHFSVKAFATLIVGKTAMTATGRATLVAGVFTGSAWFINSYLDRQATIEQANANRQAATEQANANRQAATEQANADRQTATERDAKTRAYQNYQESKKSYDATPFYKTKGSKPQWDEDNWKPWSKTG